MRMNQMGMTEKKLTDEDRNKNLYRCSGKLGAMSNTASLINSNACTE